MNTSRCFAVAGFGLAGSLVLGWLPGSAAAQTLNLTQTPLFLASIVKPNVLIVYDNSQSMDGTMAGKLIAGSDPSTRGNIARSVLTSTIASYRTAFNWGLASFGLSGSPAYYYTYGYFFGSDSQVVYTNDCVGGVSASNGGLRCVDNPEPASNGLNYLTYALSGDDPSINDVLYIGGDYGPQLYGIGISGSTSYSVFTTRKIDPGSTTWIATSFNGSQGNWGFTPTDAGYLPQTPPYGRMFWLKRAWGYNNNITGSGVINQAVAPDSTAQYNALAALLAPETSTSGSGELKNAAVFTPLAGTLATAKSYFANTLGGKPTPITSTCQKNFVLLATDGNPTGKTNGSMYTLAEQQNAYNSASGTWTFSTAANEVFTNVTALRSTNVTNSASVDGSYDVKTYVVGLGETVANASSIAALNRMASLGGGYPTAFLASSQEALTNAFRQISVDITARVSAASAVSLNSGSWSADSKVFQARFSSGDWSGQLLAFSLNLAGVPQTPAVWDAGQHLLTQNWDTDRQILTYKASAALGNRGIAFRWPSNPASPGASEMDSGMIAALNTSMSGTVDSFGSQRLAYLRGNTAREMRNCTGCSAPTFRDRPTSVLGDIINSAPVYVNGATSNFRDTIESVRYSAYAATRAHATPMLYVGANDGMLHGFNSTNGAEVFAYVPWAVRNKLSAVSDTGYTHQYTVDGSPAVGDVFYNAAWHTVLVSGMSAGAPGLFGLDVSNPNAFTESTASSVVRWEISSSDTDVGYIFGQPIIAKMRNGRWMAIVGNGYNSTNGHAVLLLVDVETGAITRVDTLSGSSAAPNGLSGVAAISSANDGIADIVYAGDLAGHMWRFDLSSTSASNWKVAYGTSAAPLPLFTAASGQPITSRPDVTLFPRGGYLVTFGTGRYIDTSDNSVGSVQAVYGIWDNGSPASMGSLVNQSLFSTVAMSTTGPYYRVTTHAVGTATDGALTGDNAITLANYYANKRGWVMNLPTSGERVAAPVTVRFGKVVIATVIPNTTPCEYGGDGWLMEMDVITGNRADSSLDTDGNSEVNAGDRIALSEDVLTGNKVVSGVKIGSIPAAPSIIRLQNRKDDAKLMNTTSGSVVTQIESGNSKPSSRASWEQLQ